MDRNHSQLYLLPIFQAACHNKFFVTICNIDANNGKQVDFFRACKMSCSLWAEVFETCYFIPWCCALKLVILLQHLQSRLVYQIDRPLVLDVLVVVQLCKDSLST